MFVCRTGIYYSVCASNVYECKWLKCQSVAEKFEDLYCDDSTCAFQMYFSNFLCFAPRKVVRAVQRAVYKIKIMFFCIFFNYILREK